MGSAKISIYTGVFILMLLIGVFFIYFLSRYRSRIGSRNEAYALIRQTRDAILEKRQDARVDHRLAVIVEVSGETFQAETANISLSGAFLLCARPLPISQVCRMTMELPGPVFLALDAEVVWNNSNVPLNKVVHRGMGVRFVPKTSEDRRLLNEYLGGLLE